MCILLVYSLFIIENARSKKQNKTDIRNFNKLINMVVYVYITQNTYFPSTLFFPTLPEQWWRKGHSSTCNKRSLVLSGQEFPAHLPLDEIWRLCIWYCFKHQKVLNWLQARRVLSKFHSVPPWNFYDRIWNESLLLPATEYKINR